MKVEKRRRCISNEEAAAIAVRIFKGETAAAIAAELGVSGSYLSRCVARAKAAGCFYFTVDGETAERLERALDAQAFIGPLAPTKSELVERIRRQQSRWPS